MRYEERLTVPRIWHVWAAVCAGVFGSYFTAYIGSTWIRIVVYGAVLAAIEAALWVLGRPRLTVTNDALIVADRTVARDSVREVATYPDVRTVLAPDTFAVTRPWIHTGVRIRTAGNVWVVSSRHPDRLRAAISQPAVH